MKENSEKKILILSSDKYPPLRVDVKDLFGVELCKKRYKFDWILQSEKEISYPINETLYCGQVWVGKTNNGQRWYQRIHKHLLGFIGDLRLFRLDLSAYDAIQVKDKLLAALIALVVLRGKNTKFFYWLSYPFPEASLYAVEHGGARYPIFYILRGHIQIYLMYKIIFRYADHIFVQSEQMKKDVENNGVSGDKITAVPMGISDDNLPSNSDCNNDKTSDTKVVLYLGTLIKVRKMDFVVRAFSKVKNAYGDVQLQFVGGGEDDEDIDIIKNEIKKCGLNSNDVLITGFLPMKEAWSFVRDSDVCISPFFPTPILNSTSPTKLIEYMSFAKPVVANDHPEQKKVIEESGAGICVDYDEDGFANAIIDILRDSDLAEEMGKKGRIYVENNRTYSKLSKIVDDQYRKLL